MGNVANYFVVNAKHVMGDWTCRLRRRVCRCSIVEESSHEEESRGGETEEESKERRGEHSLKHYSIAIHWLF